MNKRTHAIVLIALIFVILGIVIGGLYTHKLSDQPIPRRPTDPIMYADLARIERGINAFIRLFQNDGTVRYTVDFERGGPSSKQNRVREMGSGYGLAYIYAATHRPDLRPIVARFLSYARRISVIQGATALVAGDGQKPMKSGATALALLAALYYESESGDTTYADIRAKWARGLMRLFTPGVGVATAPDNPGMSPYYEGETWLALAVYHKLYPENREVAMMMPDLNKTMFDKYAATYRYNFFHWGAQAAAVEYSLTHDPLMKSYLETQMELYLQEPIRDGSSACAYAEGLGSFLTVMPASESSYVQPVRQRLAEQLQVPRLLQDTVYRAHVQHKIAPDSVPFLGLFLNTPNHFKTRSDVSQHCLIALLKAQQVLTPEKSPRRKGRGHR